MELDDDFNAIDKSLKIGDREAPRNSHVTVGTHGATIFSGFIQDNELNRALAGDQKYKTYSNILANTAVVSAGVRYFLNLTARQTWTFSPSEADTDGKYAELAEEILTKDPRTPWHRIVRRAATFRFYGFSIQEWTAIRRKDGVITFKDVAPRAQKTIEKWDVDSDGEVRSVTQRSPQDFREIVIPRNKCVYLVDDTLNDSPEGLGLFRHLAEPAQRLNVYQNLEKVGFETDLRGIPVGRGPFTEIARMVKDGTLGKAEAEKIEKPLRDFIENHIKNPKLGLVLDSMVYHTVDDAEKPSTVKQWDIDLLKSGSTSLPDLAKAISRINKELARVLGVEQMLLGEDSNGSFALSKDKTNSFFLLIDGALREIKDAVKVDLLETAWLLNGWPVEMLPEIGVEAVRFQDVEQITSALREMHSAGVPLSPEDPAVNEVRELLGLSHATIDTLMEELEQTITGSEDETPEETTEKIRKLIEARKGDRP